MLYFLFLFVYVWYVYVSVFRLFLLLIVFLVSFFVFLVVLFDFCSCCFALLCSTCRGCAGDPAGHQLDHRARRAETRSLPLGLHVIQAGDRHQPQGEKERKRERKKGRTDALLLAQTVAFETQSSNFVFFVQEMGGRYGDDEMVGRTTRRPLLVCFGGRWDRARDAQQ